jgi:hypothetical protein
MSVSGNFNKWFAVEGDVSGYYKTFAVAGVPTNSCVYFGVCGASLKTTDYAYAAGPRINFRPVFIHALFGGDHLTDTLTDSGVPGNQSESQDGVAGLAGGGVQFKVSGRWSVRASADYVFTRHNIFGGPSATQNNYRAGVGIVYGFGTRHGESAMRVPEPSAPADTQPPTPHATTPAERATTGLAQERSTEVFGGYSYLNADNNGGGGPRSNLNGWEAAVSTDLTKRIAIEGDFGGNYRSLAQPGLCAA